MPKQKKPKQGEQHPRIKITPSYDYTDGIDAGDLACAYGLTPDKWQQDLLNICLGRDKDDHFTSSTFALSVPRQNGKNGFLEMIELYHLTTGSHNILHTAHEVKTARKSFMRLAQFFTHNEDLAEICKSIRYANGQEAIYCEWKDEKGRIKTSSIEWSARSRGAARGFSCSMIVLDEAQELTNEQMQALMPTLSAANEGQRQVIMTGTPPPPGSVGDVFRNTRRSALSDGTNKDGLSWLEWSVDEPKDVNDKQWWWKTNPAMGIRISEEWTQQEANTLSADGFNRERLGYWDMNAQGEDHPINIDNWRLCKIDKPSDEIGIICYGIKFSLDGKFAALSVCNKLANQKAHVETLEYKSTVNGLTWLYDYIEPNLKKIAHVMLDGNVNCDSVIEHLKNAGASKSQIIYAKTSDMGYACQTLANSVKEHSITHIDQQLLTDSAIDCVKRPIGRLGAWGFDDFLNGSAIVIESAALALYAANKSTRNPKRKGRIF